MCVVFFCIVLGVCALLCGVVVLPHTASLTWVVRIAHCSLAWWAVSLMGARVLVTRGASVRGCASRGRVCVGAWVHGCAGAQVCRVAREEQYRCVLDVPRRPRLCVLCAILMLHRPIIWAHACSWSQCTERFVGVVCSFLVVCWVPCLTFVCALLYEFPRRKPGWRFTAGLNIECTFNIFKKHLWPNIFSKFIEGWCLNMYVC